MKTSLAFAVLTLSLAAAAAKDLKVEPGQKYLLLAATKTSTMQKELEEAAELGFRVVAGSPTSGSEMAVFLERVTEYPELYRYKLLATTRTGTMGKELNEAGAEGYRLLPLTLIAKQGLFGGPEIVCLLEKGPQSSGTFRYRLLATTLTSTLQREVTEAKEDGYVLLGMVSRDEHIVIMEKSSP